MLNVLPGFAVQRIDRHAQRQGFDRAFIASDPSTVGSSCAALNGCMDGIETNAARNTSCVVSGCLSRCPGQAARAILNANVQENCTGPAARFSDPRGVALDGVGHLFVADSGNNTIRKVVLAAGSVSTLIGLTGQ